MASLDKRKIKYMDNHKWQAKPEQQPITVIIFLTFITVISSHNKLTVHPTYAGACKFIKRNFWDVDKSFKKTNFSLIIEQRMSIRQNRSGHAITVITWVWQNKYFQSVHLCFLTISTNLQGCIKNETTNAYSFIHTQVFAKDGPKHCLICTMP